MRFKPHACKSQGTRRDAILYSVGANSGHGVRRTNADKRRAVETLLRDEEWGGWSNREIARRCGVSHEFVNQERASLATVASERTYTTKHGTTATMNTSAIGRPAKSEEPAGPVEMVEVPWDTVVNVPRDGCGGEGARLSRRPPQESPREQADVQSPTRRSRGPF